MKIFGGIMKLKTRFRILSAALAVVMLFYYKEEDLDFLSIRPKKIREIK